MGNLIRLLIVCVAMSSSLRSGGFISGSNSCPASGNKQVTSSKASAAWYVIQAPTANTGRVYIGDSGVTTSEGVFLSSGDSLSAPPRGNTASYNLADVYIACTETTDTITYVYAQ